MKVVIIDAERRLADVRDLLGMASATTAAGLKLGAVDHGVIFTRPDMSGVAIMVDEHGLFVPADMQHFFTIRGKLYAGNAVAYAFGSAGETVDLDVVPQGIEFLDAARAENMIAAGFLKRPRMAVDGRTVWQWPDPRPTFM